MALDGFNFAGAGGRGLHGNPWMLPPVHATHFLDFELAIDHRGGGKKATSRLQI
jgi:hypothetical protein